MLQAITISTCRHLSSFYSRLAGGLEGSYKDCCYATYSSFRHLVSSSRLLGSVCPGAGPLHSFTATDFGRVCLKFAWASFVLMNDAIASFPTGTSCVGWCVRKSECRDRKSSSDKVTILAGSGASMDWVCTVLLLGVVAAFHMSKWTMRFKVDDGWRDVRDDLRSRTG